MRQTAVAVMLAVAALAVLAHTVSSSLAQAQPELVESTPADGDVIERSPEQFRLCFSESVSEEGWRFNVVTPGGQPLGLRIVFDPDRICASIFPGITDPASAGIWAIEWAVRADVAGEEATGAVKFLVTGEDLGSSPSPAGTEGPGATPSPDGPQTSPDTDDDDGDGALILIIVAVVVAVGVAVAAGVVVSRRRTKAP